jgi:hypothetical protein
MYIYIIAHTEAAVEEEGNGVGDGGEEPDDGPHEWGELTG